MNESSKTDLTLGSRIREMRQGFGLSREALAREASVSVNYIRALEEDDYAALGARVYALGFLRRILLVMAIPEQADWLGRLDNAWDISLHRQEMSGVIGREKKAAMWYVTPVRAGIGFGGLLLAIFLFFAGIRLVGFVASPALVVEEPGQNEVVTEPFVMVSGRTEKESKLTVSSRELTIDRQGRFGEKIELQLGINRLEFLSENRFGKVSRVLRYVIAE